MKSNASHDNINLLGLLQPLLKWWWLLAISALLAGVTSAVYTLRQPRVYSSTTTIMVGTALTDPNPNGNEFSLASQLAAAYVDIANRSTVQNAAKAALGMTWLPDYAATYVPNTQLLEITVVDTIPKRAQAVSQALAEQLVLISPGGQAQNGRQQFIDTQLTQIEKAITETDAEIEQLQSSMAQMFSARQLADAKAQLAALDSKRSSLQDNYSAMYANSSRSATNTVVIVEPASLPSIPLNNDLVRNVVLALLLGAAIAGAGAYLLEFGNNTVSSQHELEELLELPSLGVLPRGNTKAASDLLIATAARSNLSDAYAALRLTVETTLRRQELHTVAITSPTRAERRSDLVANLSIELARSGARVILVDGDLHQPSQQRLFAMPNRFGLATLLADESLHPDELLQATEIPGLSILTSGALPANPAALLGQKRMHDILAQLRHQADFIIFDVPPVNAVVDALLLANEVDGVILTLVAQRTHKQDIERTLEAFRRIDVNVIGTIMCDAGSQAPSKFYGPVEEPVETPVNVPVAAPHASGQIAAYQNGHSAATHGSDPALNGLDSGLDGRLDGGMGHSPAAHRDLSPNASSIMPPIMPPSEPPFEPPPSPPANGVSPFSPKPPTHPIRRNPLTKR
jgi:capsular exopolysaccharide synthesis family protein